MMEAANRGAKEANGVSVGCNIVLPHEQKPNPYVDDVVSFNYFFARKVMLVKYSCAFVCMPGGFGTLDEMFEAATLIQCRKIGPFPLILMGTAFWHNLIELMYDMLQEGAICVEDTGFAFMTDSPAQAVGDDRVQPAATHHRTVVCTARRHGNGMNKPIERISISTGGGDAPGLNAVIYAVVHAAAKVGWRVFGIREGYNGLLYPEQYSDGGVIELDLEKVKNIAHLGGTILGTTNRGNPFRALERSAEGNTREVDRSSEVIDAFERHKLDAHISVGGDGSLTIALELHRKGLRVVGVPKTIDNDLRATVRRRSGSLRRCLLQRNASIGCTQRRRLTAAFWS